MGEVDGAVVQGEEPGADQAVQYRAGVPRVAEVEFGALGRAAGVGVPSPGATSRSRTRRARSAWGAVSSPYTCSAVRTTAPRSPPAASYADRVRVRPVRCRQVSSRACDIRGRAPGASATSSSSRAVRARSTVSPAAAAGRTTASRSSVRLIGPTSRVASCNAAVRPGCSAHRPRKSARTAITTRSRPPGAAAARRRSTKAVRRSASGQSVYSSSNWSTISQVSASVSGTGSAGRRGWRAGRRRG